MSHDCFFSASRQKKIGVFAFPFPQELCAGMDHELRARRNGTQRELQRAQLDLWPESHVVSRPNVMAGHALVGTTENDFVWLMISPDLIAHTTWVDLDANHWDVY